MTVMFRPPRKDILAPLLETARNSSAVNAVPATMQGVREFVRALRRGESVGMLPDQAPGVGDGVWAPFFGRMAYTMTLPGKLATQTGVPIILTAGERLPGGRGWRIHYVRVPEPLPAEPEAQAALLNAAMETLIRRCPEQYLWSYNRYKTPRGRAGPAGRRDPDRRLSRTLLRSPGISFLRHEQSQENTHARYPDEMVRPDAAVHPAARRRGARLAGPEAGEVARAHRAQES